MAGRKLNSISRKFGRPSTIILSPEEGKAENFLNVIRKVEPHLFDMPFVKLYSPSIKDIIFDPGQFEAPVAKKTFSGFSGGNLVATLEDKLDENGRYVPASQELLQRFINCSKRKKNISEDEFYLNYYNKEINFEYIQSFDQPRGVLNAEFSNFQWTQVEHVGIPGHLQGINTPWLYVGQSKALFPFHLEDSNLRSVNIMLKGAPKYWFGIRNQDIEEVERILRQMPEAEDCPAFFRHKRHWIDMSLFFDKGIQIFSCIQEPGDIILTNSFHQGFNCGYNVNWAVNFFGGSENEYALSKRGSHCPARPGCNYESKSNFLNQIYNIDVKINCIIQTCQSKHFSTTNGLRQHLLKVHNQKLENSTKVGFCPICKVESSNPDVHLEQKHNLPLVWCGLCRVSFKNKKCLESHYFKYHDKKDTKCKSCPFIAETFNDIYDDHNCENE